jgi:hypothetical protein
MKSKKIISLGISCLLLLALTVSAYAEDLTLKLETGKSVVQGEEVIIPIDAVNATNAAKGVAGAAFTVTFDTAALEYLGVTSSFFGTFAAQGITPTSVDLDGTGPLSPYTQPLLANSETAGKVMVAAALAESKSISAGSKATLFLVRFKAKANAAVGATNVSLTKTSITNSDAGYPTATDIDVLMNASGTPLAFTSWDVNLGGCSVAVFDVDDRDGDGLANTVEVAVGSDPTKADSDGDGLTDKEEVDGGSNPLLADTDGDGAPDALENKAGTSLTDPNDKPAFRIVTGDLVMPGTVDSEGWQTVNIATTADTQFVAPVVVAKPASEITSTKATIIQIKDTGLVDGDNQSFKIRLWNTRINAPATLAGVSSAAENISYMVMEKGTFTLAKGIKVTAGIINAEQKVAGSFQTAKFASVLKTAPVVVASVTTVAKAVGSVVDNDIRPVNVRLNTITTAGFSYLFQEEQASADQKHGFEDISYIAWEPSMNLIQGDTDYLIEVGKKAAAVGDQLAVVPFAQPKEDVIAFLGDMQTALDKDPCSLRYTAFGKNLDNKFINISLKVQDDVSKDTLLTTHAKEAVGYFVVSSFTPVLDTDSDGLDDAAEALYGTDKAKPDTDGDGLTDKQEIDGGSNPLLADMDGDGALDGHELKAGTSLTNPYDKPAFRIVTGDLAMPGASGPEYWQTVTFAGAPAEEFVNPVVVAKPSNAGDGKATIIQIKGVTSSSFKIRQWNTSIAGGAVAGPSDVAGNISYMVMEKGTFTLAKGIKVTAGVINAEQKVAGSFQATKFASVLKTAPVVVASVTEAKNVGSVVDTDIRPVNVRLNTITTTGFSYLLQEEQASLDQKHRAEDISYIAWEPSMNLIQGDTDYLIEVGKKAAAVGNLPATIAFGQAKDGIPIFLGDMQTALDKDPSSLRYTDLTATSVTLKVEEDVSKDAVVTHVKEAVGYFVVSPYTYDLAADQDTDGLTDAVEAIYGTDKIKADTDGDGLTDKEEVDGGSNPLLADSDGDGALDGHENKAGTSLTDPNDKPAFRIQTGTIVLPGADDGWYTQTFDSAFVNPVVVAKPASEINSTEATIIQIKNVTNTSFKIRLWNTSIAAKPPASAVQATRSTAVENVDYMVVEKGTFTLPKGIKVTAGIINAEQKVASAFQTAKFTSVLKTAPVVVASVIAPNVIGPPPVADNPANVRLNTITTAGFSYMLQEEQASTDQKHGAEVISYIAWEPSLNLIQGAPDYLIEVGKKVAAVGDAVAIVPFAQPKVDIASFLGDMQTALDKDPSSLRYTTFGENADGNFINVSLKVQDDVSKDYLLTTHAKEAVGYIVTSPTER